MRSTIFKTVVEMPPKDNSPDVTRVAQTMAEMHKNYLPAAMPNKDASVECVERPRRGYGY